MLGLRLKNVDIMMPVRVEAIVHPIRSKVEAMRAVNRIDVASDRYRIALTACVGEATEVMRVPSVPVDDAIAKPYATVNPKDIPARIASTSVHLICTIGLSNFRGILTGNRELGVTASFMLE